MRATSGITIFAVEQSLSTQRASTNRSCSRLIRATNDSHKQRLLSITRTLIFSLANMQVSSSRNQCNIHNDTKPERQSRRAVTRGVGARCSDLWQVGA